MAAFLTSIIPVFDEGPLLLTSVTSILGQSFKDFELLIIADGATPRTLAVLETLTDPRIRIIHQANAGLSTARNRGMAEAKGAWITFLDADDSRPPWAFAEIARAAETAPDLILCPGVVREERGTFKPFFDQETFEAIAAVPQDLRRLALALQPQSANKVVSRQFLDRTGLRFPDGLFFEDLLFHLGAVLQADSIAVLEVPAFCYIRRFQRAQITSTSGRLRLDSIAVVRLALDHFADLAFAKGLAEPVLNACQTFLAWNESRCGHMQRAEFRLALATMKRLVDPRWQALWETP